LFCIFSEFYFIFYAFLKLIQISKNIKESKNQKPMHSSGPAPTHCFTLLAQPSHRSGLCAGAARCMVTTRAAVRWRVPRG
jgi:hypothetical protein